MSPRRQAARALLRAWALVLGWALALVVWHDPVWIAVFMGFHLFLSLVLLGFSHRDLRREIERAAARKVQ